MRACLVTRPALFTARRWIGIREATTYSTKTTPKSFTQKAIIKHGDYLHFAYTSDSSWAFKSRSILRGLLRQSTYLPDPNARLFVRQHALSRFRKYAFKTWEHRNDPAFGTRLEAKLSEGRKELHRLQRANEGDRKALLKILLYTYGRVGPRKYALMEPLMPGVRRDEMQKIIKEIKDVEDDESVKQEGHDEEDTLQEARDGEPENSLPELTPALSALAKSQKEAGPPNDTGRNPKQLKPVIPERNARLLPMPRKRVVNMAKKWYADILGRLLPPLSPASWEQLRSWALGSEIPTVTIPRRRAIGHDAARIHFGKNTALEAIVVQGRIDNRIFDHGERHRITPRFMQRLWAQVFSQCSLMEWDEERKKWNVTWGHHELSSAVRKTANTTNISTPSVDMGDSLSALNGEQKFTEPT